MSVDLHQKATCRHYRAVEGETFMVPCINPVNVEWRREQSGGDKDLSFKCGEEFIADTRHSGNYTSVTG